MISLTKTRVLRHPIWAGEYITLCPHCKRLTDFKRQYVKNILCKLCGEVFGLDPKNTVVEEWACLYDGDQRII